MLILLVRYLLVRSLIKFDGEDMHCLTQFGLLHGSLVNRSISSIYSLFKRRHRCKIVAVMFFRGIGLRCGIFVRLLTRIINNASTTLLLTYLRSKLEPCDYWISKLKRLESLMLPTLLIQKLLLVLFNCIRQKVSLQCAGASLWSMASWNQ